MSSRRDDISARVVLPPQPVEAAAPRAAGEPDSRSALWATLFAVLRELGVRGALLRPPNGARPPPLDWHPRWPRFAGEPWAFSFACEHACRALLSLACTCRAYQRAALLREQL
jgi:hypothetical protein